MQSLLRVILLCAFAAAGAGLAVSLVVQTESQEPGAADSPLSKLLANVNRVVPSPLIGSAAKPTEAAPTESDSPEGDSGGGLEETLSDIHPSSAELHGPVASQHQQLQQTLVRVEQANQQSRLERLERTLQRVEQAAERNERLLAETPPRLTAQLSGEAAGGACETDRTNDVPGAAHDGAATDGGAAADMQAGHVPAAESPPQPGQSKIQRGAGDGWLLINLRNSDIRDVLDYLSEQSDVNILASPNVQGSVTASQPPAADVPDTTPSDDGVVRVKTRPGARSGRLLPH